MSIRKQIDKICVAGIVFWFMGIYVRGGFQPSLYIGNEVPVRDEYGHPMAGAMLSSMETNCSRIEIHVATDGIIHPPSITGGAHPNNPLLEEDGIGKIGQNATDANSGLFCLMFSAQPAGGAKIFGRAFNAQTTTQATFYADSALAVLPEGEATLVLSFEKAKPLDPGDDDSDGLNNSWEQELEIYDRPTADYDGDGMSDLHEMLAGTAPNDPSSKLAFRSIRPDAGPAPADAGPEWTKPVRVKWQSVPGKTYQLQYVPALLGEQEFIPVGDHVTAAAGEYEIERVVDVHENALTGTFRVKLVQE